MVAREFTLTEKDESGNIYHDMVFLEYPDGKIEKIWDWFNNGKEITVIQTRNRDRNGNYYTTVHKYQASVKVYNGHIW